MSTTRKADGRRGDLSVLYCALGFVPFLNSLFLLRMNDTADKKQWKILSWIMIGLNTAVIAFWFLLTAWPEYRSVAVRDFADLFCIGTLIVSNVLFWLYLISQRSAYLRAREQQGVREQSGRFGSAFFLLFGFVPFVNSAFLLCMNDAVRKKQWKTLAWITFCLNMLFLFGWVIGIQITEDLWLGRTWDTFLFSHDAYRTTSDVLDTVCMSGVLLTNFLLWLFMISKRAAYQRAAADMCAPGSKAWRRRQSVLFIFGMIPLVNSVVLFRLSDNSRNPKWRRLAWVMIGLNMVLIIGLFLGGATRIGGILRPLGGFVLAVANLALWFYLISARDDYLRAASGVGDKDVLRERLRDELSAPAHDEQTTPAHDEQTTPAPERVDLNAASEDELSRLPDLTIVDVKRAVEHRSANGGFRSTDEFFEVIRARPHIIAHLRDTVYVGAVQPEPPQPKPPHGSDRKTGTTRPLDF